MQNLIANKKLIRHYVGLEMKLKYIPELRFYHDSTMEYAEKVSMVDEIKLRGIDKAKKVYSI